MAEAFAVGDLVRRRSGEGATMTVAALRTPKSADKPAQCRALWFDGSALRRERIETAALQRAETIPPPILSDDD